MIRIKNSFDLKGVLLSGQCFRVSQDDNEYTVILKDRIVKITEDKKYLYIKSNNEINLKEVIEEYFDLNRDYKSINDYIVKRDASLKSVILNNHRILKQDEFEMFISYIISQNNNVKRISKSIDVICRKFGREVLFENKKYYLFPTKEKLINIKIEDLKDAKLGFRDKYIMNALNVIKNDPNYLDKISKMDTKDAMNELIKIKGIGPKVASCILMFGYRRFDSYPIDTWAKKYLVEKYNIKNTKDLQKELFNKYGNYVGLAVQYMYNYERNIKVNNIN